ncbi:MAG TPA: ATP-binding cassette domain-containing protein [Thermoanaerobaculia bacterium]|nr:ATP-binding cassette domain-containing protein [Thermoanaerobaculia bacterium]
MSDEPILSYREVVAGYAKPVVGPVSFDLGPGDVLGLVGPNGCGKSTLIGALTGTSKVLSGEVVRKPGTTIAYQRQRPVRETDVPLRADELLRLTAATAEPPPSLRPLLKTRVDRLSGGQFQLLTVWACLGGDARLVILDEPTNNMDPDAVAALSELLLSSRGDRAVLVVTHDARFFTGVPARVLEVGR